MSFLREGAKIGGFECCSEGVGPRTRNGSQGQAPHSPWHWQLETLGIPSALTPIGQLISPGLHPRPFLGAGPRRAPTSPGAHWNLTVFLLCQSRVVYWLKSLRGPFFSVLIVKENVCNHDVLQERLAYQHSVILFESRVFIEN